MSEQVLPYSRHTICEDDISAVLSVLRGDWLTSGPPSNALKMRWPRQRAHRALAAVLPKRYGNIRLEGSARYYARTLSLQLYPSLRDQDVDRVVAELALTLNPAANESVNLPRTEFGLVEKWPRHGLCQR
jgi:dTDP-4-amino-4,6-dideoxygalactose transaminase